MIGSRHKTRPAVTAAATLLLALANSYAGASDRVLIEDFEADTSPDPWFVQSIDPEAQVSMAAVSGPSGKRGRLTFAIPQAGSWVQAALALDLPASPQVLELWIKAPVDVHLELMIIDELGEELGYDLVRPFTALDPASTFRAAVDLRAPDDHDMDDGEIDGSIKGLALRVTSALPGVAGAVIFDEVALCPMPEMALDPEAVPGQLLQLSPESMEQRLGINIHFFDEGILEHQWALDLIRESGYTWVRTDLAWADAEPQVGSFDFSPWDAVLEAVEARRLRTLLILDYGHPVHTGGGPPVTTGEIDAFCDFVEAAVRHFSGRAVRYEIWNEPNATSFWPPDADPAAFSALVRAAAARAHTADPSALVASGGLAWHAYSYLDAMLAAGVGEADAIGLHPYLEIPEHLAFYLPLMKAILADHRVELPVWQTEWGYASAGPEGGDSPQARYDQAVLLSRELLLCWAMDLPLSITYELVDGGSDTSDPEQGFGLLTWDGQAKPALDSVRSIVDLSWTLVPSGFIETPLSNLHMLRLDGNGSHCFALWYTAPRGEVLLRLPDGASASDLFQQALEPHENHISLSRGLGPVLVTPYAVPPPPRRIGGRRQ